MWFEKYLIKKGKTDLLSSLQALDQKIINENLKEYDLKNIKELKDFILKDFETCLEMAKDDIFTQMYFQRLLENENSMLMSVNRDDVKALWAFVYENNQHCSYYIPTEIKEIIRQILYDISPVERLNLENAIDSPVIKDLRKLLNQSVVKDLRHIGDLFLIRRLSNKPKKELVNIIYDALTNEKKLAGVIERFVDKEFHLLKELISHKGTIQNNTIGMDEYYFLYKLGIVFLFKDNHKFYISMPDDVYKVLKKMDLHKFEQFVEDNTKVYTLLRAMIGLYGVVSYGDLENAYNHYYEKDEVVDIPSSVLYFCDRCDLIEDVHSQRTLYFVDEILTHDELKPIFEEIIERQNEIRRKPIELHELLKYADWNSYEDNDSKRKFKKYLKKQNISDEVIEDIILNIANLYRLGYTAIEVSLGLLQEYGVKLTKQNAQKVLNYLIDIYNHTRVWSNNGWAPSEMGKNGK